MAFQEIITWREEGILVAATAKGYGVAQEALQDVVDALGFATLKAYVETLEAEQATFMRRFHHVRRGDGDVDVG